MHLFPCIFVHPFFLVVYIFVRRSFDSTSRYILWSSFFSCDLNEDECAGLIKLDRVCFYSAVHHCLSNDLELEIWGFSSKEKKRNVQKCWERKKNKKRKHTHTHTHTHIYIYIYRVERWNCHPRKDDMILFPFNENLFSFFVVDHLLFGQLCTNPKSDRNLLSCLKVIQCSTSKIEDRLLYNSWSLQIQVMTTGPLPAPSKSKSGRFNVPRGMKTNFPATVMVFGVVWSEGHIMPPHIFEVGLKVNANVYLDVFKSVVIPSGGRPWMWQQNSVPTHKSKETKAWLQKEYYGFVPFSHCAPSSPDLNPLDYFVWSSPT